MRKAFHLVAALIILTLALSARGALIVNLEGFTKGDATAKGHPGAIAALRFDLSVSAAREGAGAAAEKLVVHHPIVITRELDAASPQLFQALSSREEFQLLTLELTKPEAQGKEAVYYTVKLTKVFITTIRQYTDEHSGAGLEDISFSYERIDVESGATPANTPTPKSPSIHNK